MYSQVNGPSLIPISKELWDRDNRDIMCYELKAVFKKKIFSYMFYTQYMPPFSTKQCNLFNSMYFLKITCNSPNNISCRDRIFLLEVPLLLVLFWMDDACHDTEAPERLWCLISDDTEI